MDGSRATTAAIDLNAIAFNVNQIKERVRPAKVMAVVKANAYGHGAVPVAKRIVQEGVEDLAVALVEEGIELREHGIRSPILVFGGFFPQEIPLFLEYDLDFTLYSEQNLSALRQAAKRIKKRPRVHIKVDTGMGRIGVPVEQAEEFIREVYRSKEIQVIGLYTHFATSDERDKSFANIQIQRFRELITRLEKQRVNIPKKHMANSAAILDLPESYFDLVRPGIMLYGYYPSRETSESVPLKPAMTLKSRVVFIKEIPAGTGVSYGRTFIAPTRTRIATIPVGYADGYNRLLSNRGYVSIRGEQYPVVGRVCMDQILVDVGQQYEIAVGDEVILFGPEYGEKVSVPYICATVGTIPYEVCCWVSYRVPRVFIEAEGVD